MPSSVDLGPKLEGVIEELISKGRYGSKSEVIREGVRLVEEREKRLAELDRALALGQADIEAGRVYDGDTVFADVKRRIAEVATKKRKKRH